MRATRRTAAGCSGADGALRIPVEGQRPLTGSGGIRVGPDSAAADTGRAVTRRADAGSNETIPAGMRTTTARSTAKARIFATMGARSNEGSRTNLENKLQGGLVEHRGIRRQRFRRVDPHLRREAIARGRLD